MKRWIQKAVKRKGRVKKYLKRVYGNRAFTSKGTIKQEYLNKAEKRAEKTKNTSLAQAIRLAKRLKKMKK